MMPENQSASRESEGRGERQLGGPSDFSENGLEESRDHLNPGSAMQNSQLSSGAQSSDLLSDSKSNMETRINEMKVIIAAGTGNSEELDSLIKQQTSVDSRDEDGNTPLHHAVQSGNEKVVESLLSKVKDIGLENNEYDTPMDIAVRNDNSKLIELLQNRMVNDSFVAMEKALSGIKKGDHARPTKTHKETPISTEVKINQTKEKIKYCLESLRELNKSRDNTEQLSREEARVLIYFLSILVLEDSSDQKFNDKMKKHRSQCEHNDVYKDIIADAKKWRERSANEPELNLEVATEYMKSSKNKSTKARSNYEELSNEQAYVLIHFREAFVLEGFVIEQIKQRIKQQLSIMIIDRVRNVDITSTVTDKFDDNDKNSLFEKLEKSLEHLYAQANIFIYFVEAFALEGRDPELKPEMEKYFSMCYSSFDRDIITNARELLLKRSNRKLRLEDVHKFMNASDEESFFADLQQYVERVEFSLEIADILLAMQKAISSTSGTENIEQLKNVVNRCMESFRDSCKDKNVCEQQTSIILECYGILKFSNGYSNDGIDETMKRYFSTHFREEDGIQISDALEDKIKLTQYAAEIKQNKVESTTKELKKFMKKLKNQERRLGLEISGNERSFLNEQLNKLRRTACTPKDITQGDLFNFIVVFYPVFETKSNVNGDIIELRSLRNRLLHEFHKHGCVEFADEVSKLRYELFRYCYALEVRDVLSLCANEPGATNPATILQMLNDGLKSVNDDRDITGTGHVLSDIEATDKCEYKRRETFLSAKDEYPQTSVRRYLWFLILMSNRSTQKENSIPPSVNSPAESSLSDETDEKSKPSLIADMSDLDRRKMFEEICKLERYKQYDLEYHDEKMQEFKTKLIDNYGVPEYHFDHVYQLFTKFNDKSVDDSVIKQFNNTSTTVTKYIKNLEHIMDQFKLTYREVKHLYEKYLNGYDGYKPIDKVIKDTLPRGESIHLSIDDKIYKICVGKTVIEMFKILYGAYSVYEIRVTVEEMFNDQIFLDYLVDKETEDKKMKQSVDAYLRMAFMINSLEQAAKPCPNCSGRENIFIRKMHLLVHQFQRLKLLRKNLQYKTNKHFYEEKKQEFKELLIVPCCSEHMKGLIYENDGFEKLYQLYIESDDDFGHNAEIIKKIRSIIDNFLEKLEQLKLKINDETFRVVRLLFASTTNFADVTRLLENILDESVKHHLTTLTELYKELEPDENESNTTKNLSANSCKTVGRIVVNGIMSSASETKLRFKNETNIYAIINQLLAVDCTAPYIARLLTKVESDGIIGTEGLVKLVGILSKGSKFSMEHLNRLLDINSSKFDLYEEVCDQILEQNLNVESMRPIFKEPRHVKGILAALNRRIEEINKSRDKSTSNVQEDETLDNTVELPKELRHVKGIWAGLNHRIEINESQDCPSEYSEDDGNPVKIDDLTKQLLHIKGIFNLLNPIFEELKESRDKSASKDLPDDETLDRTFELTKTILQFLDTEVLETMGQYRIHNALEISDAALKILSTFKHMGKISDLFVLDYKLRKAEALMRLRDRRKALQVLSGIPAEITPQYLLATSYKPVIFIAMKKYDDAYKEWDTLCERMIQFVHCSTEDESHHSPAHNDKVWMGVMNEKRYCDLLASSKKYEIHLYIPLFRLKMIYCALKSGISSNLNGQEYEMALKLYKIHRSYRNKLKLQLDDLVTQYLVRIMALPTRMCQNPKDNELFSYQVSSQLSFAMLAERQRVLKIERNENRYNYPEMPTYIMTMEMILYCIACVKLLNPNFSAVLKIYDRIIRLRKTYGFYHFSSRITRQAPLYSRLVELSLHYHCITEKKILEQINDSQMDTAWIYKRISRTFKTSISDQQCEKTLCLINDSCDFLFNNELSVETIMHSITSSIQDCEKPWPLSMSDIALLIHEVISNLLANRDANDGYDIQIIINNIPDHCKINELIAEGSSNPEEQRYKLHEIVSMIRQVTIQELKRQFKITFEKITSVQQFADHIAQTFRPECQYSESEMFSLIENRVPSVVQQILNDMNLTNSHEMNLELFIDILITYCVTDESAMHSLIDEKLFAKRDKFFYHLVVILMSNEVVAFPDESSRRRAAIVILNNHWHYANHCERLVCDPCGPGIIR